MLSACAGRGLHWTLTLPREVTLHQVVTLHQKVTLHQEMTLHQEVTLHWEVRRQTELKLVWCPCLVVRILCADWKLEAPLAVAV